MATQLDYQLAVQQVREKLESILVRAWGSLGSYRDADIDRLVRAVVPHVQAGQVAVARLTAVYFRNAGYHAGIDAEWVMSGRGVPVDDVYRRPATTVYTALSEGKSLDDAIAAGGTRLVSLAMTDLQMAKVRQAQRSLQGAGVDAFRRVLTGKENCALCVIASTQRYHSKDLLPIHPGCDCSVDTLPKGFDPSQQVIDPDLLELTHRAVESKTGQSDRGARTPDYRQLIMTREHGEYGPTLTWRADKFTSKADIPELD